MLQLVGCKYKWWVDGDVCYGNNGPFYASYDTLPSIEQIKKEGICCAGVINLACRLVGAEIPGVQEKHMYAGGTYLWEQWAREKHALMPIVDCPPPPNSILVLPYENPEQQGHVALMMKNNMVLHSYSYNYEPTAGTLEDPGVVLEPFETVLNMFDFNLYIPPEKWMFNALASASE